MANKRISELSSLDGQIANEDLFLIQDVSPISESKSVSWGYLSTVIAASASVESASYSMTSSVADLIISSSWASSSISSSFAHSASGSGVIAATSDWATSCSYATRADYASGSGIFAITSSYSDLSNFATNSSSSISSSYAISASYASGSGVFAATSSYAFSSSFSETASNSNYSSNGIETGYMVLYAGEDTTDIVSTGDYLVCDGADVLESEYPDLYDSIGKKFGYYPKLTITAARTAFSQLMNVYVDSETFRYVLHGNNFFSSGRWVLYRNYNGKIRFVPQTSIGGGIYTITCLFGGITTSSVKIISDVTPTASFDNLVGGPGGNYRFIISELTTNYNFTYDVNVKFDNNDLQTTSSVSFGDYTAITFTPTSTELYSSKFRVTDGRTLQSDEGCLRQSSPLSIVEQTAATLLLEDDAPFTCSVIRYSGSYNDLPSASLAQSRNSLEFVGYNNGSSLPLAYTFSSSFFVPNLQGDLSQQSLGENAPNNVNPSNADIISASYDYAFRYLIKT